MLRPILITALISYAILLVIVWFVPLEFTACTKDSFWCSFAFWVTESAGKYGTVLIILLAGVFYSLRFESWKGKIFNFCKSVVALVVFLSVFAWLNEHITKKATRIPRPSHAYIFQHSNPAIKLDSLYRIEKNERRKFLTGLIQANGPAFANFDQKVLAHWAEEAGYSFPSGHSFNAFVLACILGFGMFSSKRNISRYVWFLPLCWAPVVALSRVAIGAHSALDVSFGGGMGILIAMSFLYFDNTRKWLIHRKRS
jgi:phosphatidylglycerophosphatase B